MSEIEKALDAVKQAVRLTPNNIPLASHYIRQLLSLLRYAEAEEELKELLLKNPRSKQLQLLMADCYYRQNKNSHALAIVETLVDGIDPMPEALILQAKLFYRAGNVQDAVAKYKQAVDMDEEISNSDFENLLGISHWEDDLESDDVSEAFDGRLRQFTDGDMGDEEVAVPMERPTINFSDVGGMTKVKEDIQVKIIFPLQHAEMYAAYGKKAGGGILMYGPPGCGKTHLARATAGEVKAQFVSIGINDILDMWIGNSERNLHSYFENARQRSPCVMFFDEVDALGASRADMRQSSGRHLVNQFLSELDGIESNNDGLLILGATNAPWHVDAAFRRPGRFDQVIFVPPPDETARVEILQILLQGKPIDDINYQQVASKTNEYSGADLSAVVSRAIEAKLHDAIRTGKPTPVTTKDLLASLKLVKPSTREWFATAKNHALYANQGGTYDDILQYLKLK